MNARVLVAVFAIFATGLLPFNPGAAGMELSDDAVGAHSYSVVFGSPVESALALDHLVARANLDVFPALVLAFRFNPVSPEIIDAATQLAGEPISDWRDAMLWQEAHPEIVPHMSYRDIKLEVFLRLDPAFLRFLNGDRSRSQNMDIRLEEITWGGVRVDGIPALDDPELIAAENAQYLRPDDLVFGVEINGDARAYPLRIMGWHEMFNDTIGGVPVALAYCTLCGAGILFETKVPGRQKPLVFGSSGFLYRSNKLMFDRQTDSLWNQFTGEPVTGPLRGSGIRLKIRPVTITSWENWQARNPQTRVLSLNTGHQRDYGSGVVYRDYFASPDLMFPTRIGNEDIVRRKDFVFGIREFGASRAWPVVVFGDGRVINDQIGGRDVVLIGDARTRTVRAYQRLDREFRAGNSVDTLVGPDGVWTITEAGLMNDKGETLERIPGHLSYWFAWDGYLGIDSSLYEEAQ